MSGSSIRPLRSAQQVDHPAGAHLPEHAHDTGQLIVVLRGTAAISSEGGWWLAPPGLAIWVPPHCRHSAHYSESSSLVTLLMAPGADDRVPVRCGIIAVSPLMRELALEGAREYEAAEVRSDLVGRLLLEQMSGRALSPMLFVPDGRDPRLRAAIGLLRIDPGKSMTVAELARAVHTSPRTLSRLFLEETRMSYGRWRDHMRIVCAVDRLARGRSITATALELGYRSASSFTTLFTRSLGMPPRRYMSTLAS